MATYLSVPGDIYNPPTYASDDLVRCADPDCGQTHDADDEDYTFERIDGDAYCSRRNSTAPSTCYSRALDAAYRREIADSVLGKLQAVLADLKAVDKLYPGACENEPTPHEMIEDSIARLQSFTQGEEMGWANDVMLDYTEASALRFTLERTIQRRSFSLCSDLAEARPGRTMLPFALANEATELGKLGGQLLTLNAAQSRTEKGRAA